MIPNDWHFSTLGNIANLYTGNSINENIKLEKYTGKTIGINYISTKDINFDNIINYDTNVKIPESDGYKIAPANTTLLCIEGGSAGRKIGFTNQPVCFVNKLCAFVAVNINSKYMYYFLQTLDFINQFNNKKHGLIGGVSIKELSSIKIPLPPLDEQQRIVNIIENLFAKLDNARKLAQNVIDSYELRRSAILNKAFTGQLTNSNIDDWSRIQLQNIIELLSGQDFRQDEYNSEEKGIPYITGASNFKANHVVINRWTLKPTVIAQNSDILLVCKGSGYGKTIIADFDKAHIARQIMALRVNDDVENQFIYYFLQFKFDYIRESGQGLIPGIPRRIILNMNINLPNLGEQKEIVRILDSLLTKEQRTKELAEQTLQRIDLMKKAVLAKAFRGELINNGQVKCT